MYILYSDTCVVGAGQVVIIEIETDPSVFAQYSTVVYLFFRQGCGDNRASDLCEESH